MPRKWMTMLLIGMLALGSATACGARRDRDTAPTAPASESVGAQAEQELDALIATLEAEAAPEELGEFVP